jgi:CRISPR/Cas system-associated exonuclease Cas4 (RecB family)
LFVTPHHTTTFSHTSWVSSATITTTTRALPTAVPSKALVVLAVPVSVALVVLEDSGPLVATREDLDLADLRVDLAVLGATTEAREAPVDLADLMAVLEALEEIMVDLEVPVALAVTKEVYVYHSLIDGRAFADVRIA